MVAKSIAKMYTNIHKPTDYTPVGIFRNLHISEGHQLIGVAKRGFHHRMHEDRNGCRNGWPYFGHRFEPHEYRDETETPAMNLLISDMEEWPDPASTLHSDDDDRLNPPGPQVENTRANLKSLQLGMHTLRFKPEYFTILFKRRKH